MTDYYCWYRQHLTTKRRFGWSNNQMWYISAWCDDLMKVGNITDTANILECYFYGRCTILSTQAYEDFALRRRQAGRRKQEAGAANRIRLNQLLFTGSARARARAHLSIGLTWYCVKNEVV